jgi:nucleoside-diphosphate-sugar epimerase/phytoene/squalene synthetase
MTKTDHEARAKADHAFCERMLPLVSRTFALSIQALPLCLRDAVGVAYLLCRVVDTIEDDAKIRSRRDPLFDSFDRALEASRVAEPEALGRETGEYERLCEAVKLGPTDAERELVSGAGSVFRVYAGLSAYQREAIYPHVAEMSAGMREYSARADSAPNNLRLRDLADLERYCYFVAGTVGGLLTSLFVGTFPGGAPWGQDEAREAAMRERAVSFGLGLQLVNIVKDVASDFERGDCFLPEAMAEQHGFALEDTLDPLVRPRGLALLRALCDRARKHLDRAAEYTIAWPAEDGEGKSIRLFCAVPLALAYATLREVEDGRDALVRGRAPTVSRSLVQAVFAEALASVGDDAALRALFERCRYGAIGRCPRPPEPARATGAARPQASASTSTSIPREKMQHDSAFNPANDRNFTGKVFVTGGAGHLGANLVHRLLTDGRDVRVLLQPGANNDAIDALERTTGKKLDRFMGDLRDLSSMRRALEGCETAYHVAAKVSTLNDTPDALREIYGSNVLGTANLLRAAREAGTKRVVVSGSFSAVGYDEQDPSKPADESVPFYPFDEHLAYGRTKVQVEHEVLKAVAEGQDVVIATSCAVLGPWDYIPSRMGRTLMDFTHGRLRAYIPGGFEFVAAKDIVEGHVLAMKRGRTGQKYIISTEFLTVDEIMDIFEEVSGRPRPKLRLPAPVMMGVAHVTSFVLTNFFPSVPQRFTPGAVRILSMQRHADTTKAKTELGFQPSSIRQAIHEAYADFARRGLVPRTPTQRGLEDAAPSSSDVSNDKAVGSKPKSDAAAERGAA